MNSQYRQKTWQTAVRREVWILPDVAGIVIYQVMEILADCIIGIMTYQVTDIVIDYVVGVWKLP